MNQSCADWVRRCLARIAPPESVVELGSYDVNGNVRGLFRYYTGVDIRPGPNVDIVADAAEVGGRYDLALSLNMLEHAEEPERVLQNVHNLAPTLILTAAGPHWPPHGWQGGAVGGEPYQGIGRAMLSDWLAGYAYVEIEMLPDGLIAALASDEGFAKEERVESVERSGAWTLCEVCHRVIWVEDGPVCVDCRKPEPKPKPELAPELEPEEADDTCE